jgi:hypothetical protein
VYNRQGWQKKPDHCTPFLAYMIFGVHPSRQKRCTRSLYTVFPVNLFGVQSPVRKEGLKKTKPGSLIAQLPGIMYIKYIKNILKQQDHNKKFGTG